MLSPGLPIKIFNADLTKDKSKEIVLDQVNGGGVTQPFRGLQELIEVNLRAHSRCYDSRAHVFRQLGESFQAVHSFAPVFDVMIQQQPFIAALIWGSVRFIIQVRRAFTSLFSPQLASMPP